MNAIFLGILSDFVRRCCVGWTIHKFKTFVKLGTVQAGNSKHTGDDKDLPTMEERGK